MEQNNLIKRIVLFSVISICGFAASFYFLKKNSTSLSSVDKQVVKHDSIITVSLLSENNDFENEGSATTEKSSSGKKSYKLTPEIEYGIGINKMMKDIPDFQNLKQITVEVKCLSSKIKDALYVLAIDDSASKNVLWDGKPIICNKNDTWCNNEFTFNLKPEVLKAGNSIKIYPWNRAKEVFYIDDISENYIGTKNANSVIQNQNSLTNFFFDFEKMDGLTGTESIKETTSHSGKMACDMTNGREYGPLFSKVISQVSNSTLKKISASIWIYPLTDKANAVLTASITNVKGENIYWDGKSTENKIFPKNKWTKLNAGFVIPSDKVSLEDKVSLNIWNKGRTDLIVDDMEIVFGENADRKGETSTIDANSIYEKQFVPQKNKPPFKTIYFEKQEINNLSVSDFSPNDEYVVGDFIKDKNNLDELICIKNGKAQLYVYSAETKQFKAVTGKYFSADSILKSRKKIEVYNDNSIFKSTDITFAGDYFGDTKTEIIKFNTDWRFDSKLISKEKDGFNILGNIDFKGYSNDYSPKYYEFTKIVSGKFISNTKSSLLIISCNCADQNFNGKHCNQLENIAALPNSVGFYSIENK